MLYYTDASRTGSICCHKLHWPICVTDSPVNQVPIGEASEAGRAQDGQALWSLKVQGAEVPGRFVIVDGAFVEFEPGPV